MITAGSRVTWCHYPAAVRHAEHVGVVVATIPAGASLRLHEQANGLPPRAADANDIVSFDRLLVRVDRQGERGPLKPRFYAPRASAVRAEPAQPSRQEAVSR